MSDDETLGNLRCGRRVFLTCLILASKWLQDRNYSTRAWSNISGLGAGEIQQNEMAFLVAVDWKLHIREDIFRRWAGIVLRYTVESLQHSWSGADRGGWKAIIPHLTPELDNLDLILPPLRALSAPVSQKPLPPFCSVLKGRGAERPVTEIEGLA
jgi:hypothetical protein